MQSGFEDSNTCAILHTAETNIDVQIQSGTDINEALLRMGLPRLNNIPGSVGHGAREEEGEC